MMIFVIKGYIIELFAYNFHISDSQLFREANIDACSPPLVAVLNRHDPVAELSANDGWTLLRLIHSAGKTHFSFVPDV